MKKIIHIVGPTAVGKTKLAVFLAQNFDGALISADSVQVYKNLDIVSGKDLPEGSKFNLLKENNGISVGYYLFDTIRVFLLDVINFSVSFNVSSFQSIAKAVISAIQTENKQPIVVGGTGLYVQSLINENIAKSSVVNHELRKELEALPLLELQFRVSSISKNDFERLNNSEKNNPRRLIRIIENGEFTPNKINTIQENNHIIIGLECGRDELKKRIDQRIDERIKLGAIKEAENLFKDYDHLSTQIKHANGYKQLFSYLNKEINWDECLYRWKVSEYRHAKNQMTWFKKYGNVQWYDINEKDFELKILNRLKELLVESYSH